MNGTEVSSEPNASPVCRREKTLFHWLLHPAQSTLLASCRFRRREKSVVTLSDRNEIL